MKRFLVLLVSLVVLTGSAFAAGNTYPSNAPIAGGAYAEVQTTQLGRVLLYVPMETQRDVFSVDRSGNLINMTAATVNAQGYAGAAYATSVQVRFQRFGTAEYYEQQWNGNWSWAPLQITAVLNTNIMMLDEPAPIKPLSEIVPLVVVIMNGVMVIVLFLFVVGRAR